jgi:TonB family protein
MVPIMSKLTVLVLVSGLIACATPALADGHADTHVHVNLMAGPGAMKSTLPPVVSSELPSADRIHGRIKFLLGDSVTASVRVCVAPSGQVSNVKLVHGSSYAQFDQALMTDAREWKFAAKGAATNCEDISVSYHPM